MAWIGHSADAPGQVFEKVRWAYGQGAKEEVGTHQAEEGMYISVRGVYVFRGHVGSTVLKTCSANYVEFPYAATRMAR